MRLSTYCRRSTPTSVFGWRVVAVILLLDPARPSTSASTSATRNDRGLNPTTAAVDVETGPTLITNNDYGPTLTTDFDAIVPGPAPPTGDDDGSRRRHQHRRPQQAASPGGGHPPTQIGGVGGEIAFGLRRRGRARKVAAGGRVRMTAVRSDGTTSGDSGGNGGAEQQVEERTNRDALETGLLREAEAAAGFGGGESDTYTTNQDNGSGATTFRPARYRALTARFALGRGVDGAESNYPRIGSTVKVSTQDTTGKTDEVPDVGALDSSTTRQRDDRVLMEEKQEEGGGQAETDDAPYGARRVIQIDATARHRVPRLPTSTAAPSPTTASEDVDASTRIAPAGAGHRRPDRIREIPEQRNAVDEYLKDFEFTTSTIPASRAADDIANTHVGNGRRGRGLPKAYGVRGYYSDNAVVTSTERGASVTPVAAPSKPQLSKSVLQAVRSLVSPGTLSLEHRPRPTPTSEVQKPRDFNNFEIDYANENEKGWQPGVPDTGRWSEDIDVVVDYEYNYPAQLEDGSTPELAPPSSDNIPTTLVPAFGVLVTPKGQRPHDRDGTHSFLRRSELDLSSPPVINPQSVGHGARTLEEESAPAPIREERHFSKLLKHPRLHAHKKHHPKSLRRIKSFQKDEQHSLGKQGGPWSLPRRRFSKTLASYESMGRKHHVKPDTSPQDSSLKNHQLDSSDDNIPKLILTTPSNVQINPRGNQQRGIYFKSRVAHHQSTTQSEGDLQPQPLPLVRTRIHKRNTEQVILADALQNGEASENQNVTSGVEDEKVVGVLTLETSPLTFFAFEEADSINKREDDRGLSLRKEIMSEQTLVIQEDGNLSVGNVENNDQVSAARQGVTMAEKLGNQETPEEAVATIVIHALSEADTNGTDVDIDNSTSVNNDDSTVVAQGVSSTRTGKQYFPPTQDNNSYVRVAANAYVAASSLPKGSQSNDDGLEDGDSSLKYKIRLSTGGSPATTNYQNSKESVATSAYVATSSQTKTYQSPSTIVLSGGSENVGKDDGRSDDSTIGQDDSSLRTTINLTTVSNIKYGLQNTYPVYRPNGYSANSGEANAYSKPQKVNERPLPLIIVSLPPAGRVSPERLAELMRGGDGYNRVIKTASQERDDKNDDDSSSTVSQKPYTASINAKPYSSVNVAYQQPSYGASYRPSAGYTATSGLTGSYSAPKYSPPVSTYKSPYVSANRRPTYASGNRGYYGGTPALRSDDSDEVYRSRPSYSRGYSSTQNTYPSSNYRGYSRANSAANYPSPKYGYSGSSPSYRSRTVPRIVQAETYTKYVLGRPVMYIKTVAEDDRRYGSSYNRYGGSRGLSSSNYGSNYRSHSGSYNRHRTPSYSHHHSRQGAYGGSYTPTRAYSSPSVYSGSASYNRQNPVSVSTGYSQRSYYPNNYGTGYRATQVSAKDSGEDDRKSYSSPSATYTRTGTNYGSNHHYTVRTSDDDDRRSYRPKLTSYSPGTQGGYSVQQAASAATRGISVHLSSDDDDRRSYRPNLATYSYGTQPANSGASYVQLSSHVGDSSENKRKVTTTSTSDDSLSHYSRPSAKLPNGDDRPYSVKGQASDDRSRTSYAHVATKGSDDATQSGYSLSVKVGSTTGQSSVKASSEDDRRSYRPVVPNSTSQSGQSHLSLTLSSNAVALNGGGYVARGPGDDKEKVNSSGSLVRTSSVKVSGDDGRGGYSQRGSLPSGGNFYRQSLAVATTPREDDLVSNSRLLARAGKLYPPEVHGITGSEDDQTNASILRATVSAHASSQSDNDGENRKENSDGNTNSSTKGENDK